MSGYKSVDRVELAHRLETQSTVDDPVTGQAAPSEMRSRSPLWPTDPRWSHIALVAVTEQGPRRLEEFAYRPAYANCGVPVYAGADLPVAIMFERTAHGTSRARVYSAHEIVAARDPILESDPALQPERGEGDVLASYFPTLHAADLEGSVALFEADGYLQHSNGETYRGHARLREDFTKFFKTGGIRLRYCNKTDAASRTALEAYMPSGRPAVAVYERGGTGKVRAVRLYL